MRTLSQQMSDAEFIEFCYQSFLKQPASAEDSHAFVNALATFQITREEVLIRFATSPKFRNRMSELDAEFVPPGHFYSAVPSAEERQYFIDAPCKTALSVPGIDINEVGQLALLERLAPHYQACPFPEHPTDSYRYHLSNGTYSYTDGLTLFAMMREFKPRRIVEIGSGFSSAMMLDTNEHFFNGKIDLTFIEPYPELLHSVMKPADSKHTIIDTKVQEVDLELFRSLEENDILFVDSTHVSKLNSDVNTIIFDILPQLNDGVLIHFHDIFWPFEYPRAWIRDGRAWNEIYLLRAFLEFNNRFQILFFADYLHKYHESWFAQHKPECLKNSGGNIWLRKVSQHSDKGLG
ncbi:MAG: class I SAM-dependent methyltransferase [Calditrichia bacterium]